MAEFETCSWDGDAEDRECEAPQLRKRIAELETKLDQAADNAMRAAWKYADRVEEVMSLRQAIREHKTDMSRDGNDADHRLWAALEERGATDCRGI